MSLVSQPTAPGFKGCYTVFDVGGPESRLLERFRDLENAAKFAEAKVKELGRRCVVGQASVSSDVRLIDEKP